MTYDLTGFNIKVGETLEGLLTEWDVSKQSNVMSRTSLDVALFRKLKMTDKLSFTSKICLSMKISNSKLTVFESISAKC